MPLDDPAGRGGAFGHRGRCMEEEGFLRALDANPADDTLRLVFADWLEERGDNRGQFLRAAVALRNSAVRDGSFPHSLHHLLELRSAVPAAWLVRAFRDLAEDD